MWPSGKLMTRVCRWVFFKRDDAALLHPVWTDSLDPVFQVDILQLLQAQQAEGGGSPATVPLQQPWQFLDRWEVEITPGDQRRRLCCGGGVTDGAGVQVMCCMFLPAVRMPSSTCSPVWPSAPTLLTAPTWMTS